MIKKIITLILTTLSMLFFMSCKHKIIDTSIEKFTYDEASERKLEIKLSDIAKEVYYIPLETHQNALIGSGNAQVMPVDKYFFVSQADEPLHMFNNEGKYILTFGKLGRGPNEYGGYYSYTVDISTGRVFILNSQNGIILTFNFDGKDLEPINPEKKIIQFEYIGNDLFCGCVKTDNILSPNDTNYVIFNINGKILNGLHIPGASTLNFNQNEAIQITPTFCQSPDGVNIITNQNDSIYTVNDKGEIFMSLICDFGKFKAPFNMSDMSIDKKEKVKYIRFLGAIETEKFWFIGFNLSNKFHRYVLDKSNNQSFITNIIKNDLDGGPNFWPYFRNYKAKKFAILQDVLYLKQSNEAEKFNSTEIMYPKRNKYFKALLDSMELTDNPIVMVVDIK